MQVALDSHYGELLERADGEWLASPSGIAPAEGHFGDEFRAGLSARTVGAVAVHPTPVSARVAPLSLRWVGDVLAELRAAVPICARFADSLEALLELEREHEGRRVGRTWRHTFIAPTRFWRLRRDARPAARTLGIPRVSLLGLCSHVAALARTSTVVAFPRGAIVSSNYLVAFR